MGRVIDQNKPFSEEDKEYLRQRGRSYLIPANERRFGENGELAGTPEADDAGPDNHGISPFYSAEDRAAAVYDVGGAPLPGTVLDYDTGRVADRDNGVIVEYTGPGHTPGAYDLRKHYENVEGVNFGSYEVDENGNPVDDDIAPEIVEFVIEQHNTKADLVASLKKYDIEYSGSDDKETLQNKLAVGLDDKRRQGEEIDLSKD